MWQRIALKTSGTVKSAHILSSEAHVWFVTPESVCDPATLQHCYDILNEDEREKYGRFIYSEDSHSYLISHALVRNILSRYATIAPSGWRFNQGTHGRPEIIPAHQTRLRFNLTHTSGLAACIVTLDDDCGIDAENVHDRSNPLGIAKRMFSAPELEQLKQHEGPAFLEYFYERWTLREAYVKARGIGISFPTRQLCFSVNEGKVTVQFDPAIDDTDRDWDFQLIRPDAGHIVALALHDTSDKNKCIRVHRFDFNG